MTIRLLNTDVKKNFRPLPKILYLSYIRKYVGLHLTGGVLESFLSVLGHRKSAAHEKGVETVEFDASCLKFPDNPYNTPPDSIPKLRKSVVPTKKVRKTEPISPSVFNPASASEVKQNAGHPHEEAFQVEVAAYLDMALPRPGAWWCHIPNQGMFASTRQILSAGARFKKQGLKAGAPDNLIVWDGRTFFVELKSKTGRISDAQKIVIPAIESAGAPVAVARTLEEVAAALTTWGIPLTMTPAEFRDRKSIASPPTRMSVSEYKAVMGLGAAAKQKRNDSWQKKLTAALRSRETRRKPDADSEQPKTIPQSNLARDD